MKRVVASVGIQMRTDVKESVIFVSAARGAFVNVKAENAVAARSFTDGKTADLRIDDRSDFRLIEEHKPLDLRVLRVSRNPGIRVGNPAKNDRKREVRMPHHV